MQTKVGMVVAKNCGRMGNFLFQTAAAIGYALDHGLEFTVPSITNDPKWNPIYLQHLANPKWDRQLPLAFTIREEQHFYKPMPFQDKWRMGNIVLSGYWQSEKYFANHRQFILNAFQLSHPGETIRGLVSVHVRRTDYISLSKKHPPVGKEWYEKAMYEFPGATFHFFSDDIPWCRENFGNRPDCIFSEGRSEQKDLKLMTGCEHHICSASTFAWWGAWLNQNPEKRVIFPKLWFQPDHKLANQTFDIVPPEWEKL